ncbi:MAG: MFS transporter [Bacilli bacterium]|nr:MFS transporter [Bacilli bacterium]
MQLNNYKILFIFRTIKILLNLFLDSFFVLYFITLSNNNILPFGLYKLVSITVLYLTIFLLRNKCKAKNRVNLLRIGLLIYLLYFILILLLKEKIVDYMYLIGIIYGIQEGFYFSVFNILESDSISNNERARYNGDCRTLSNILSIIFPITLGGIITLSNYSISFICIIIMLLFLFILSLKIKNNNISNIQKVNIKEFIKIVKKNKALQNIYNSNIFSGLTYSSGAFLSIITIYIIKVCNNSMSLGIYTSVIAFIVAIVAFLFGRFIKKKSYIKIIYITVLISILSLIVLMFKCNMLTIILFSLFSKISWEFLYLINLTSQGNLTNINEIKDNYKVEFYQVFELSLFIGRFISFCLFILMAIIPVNYILPVFIVFLLLYMITSVKIQKNM